MNIIKVMLFVFLFPFICQARDFGTLEVKVVGLENNKGKVHVLVFYSESKDGFPNKPQKANQRQEIEINDQTCKVVFSKIPYGKWIAVSMLHDADRNNKMNKFFFPRFPLEGFGTSRVKKLQMPSYKKSKFQFDQDMEITINALYLKNLFPWLRPKKKEKKEESKIATRR